MIAEKAIWKELLMAPKNKVDLMRKGDDPREEENAE